MICAEEARKIILNNTFILGNESIHISECLNRVLADDIISKSDIPAFNNSAMDGYAVVSSILKGASDEQPVELKLCGSVKAGYTSEKEVNGNVAIKIMTGAPVPNGADAVVPLEFTCQSGLEVKIFCQVKKWANIRFCGEEIKKGQLVIAKGKTLGPIEIGILAALNIGSVSVTRSPIISLLSTGDELVNLGEALSPGKIMDINSYSLYAQIEKHGGKPRSLGIASDEKEIIRSKLEKDKNRDVLIISGGVSIGDYDYVREVLSCMGMSEKFWKVAIKPGKPVLFGIMEQTLVFGLPGNPVSAMITFNQFVLPALYKMQGKTHKPWKEVKAILEGDIERKPGFLNLIRGKTMLTDGKVYVKAVRQQSSGALSSMMFADCLIIMNKEVSQIRNGEEVLIQIMEGFGE